MGVGNGESRFPVRPPNPLELSARRGLVRVLTVSERCDVMASTLSALYAWTEEQTAITTTRTSASECF